MMEKPNVTKTTHLLPFRELSPQQFERLCLWLVEREGYLNAEHLGEAGSEEGRDVIGYRVSENGKQLWYFQCKRYQAIGAGKLMEEVEKFNKLVSVDPTKKPFGIVFVTNATLSAATREKLRMFCRKQGCECEFWARTELDLLTKKHPDIVTEFFNLPFQPITSSKISELPEPIRRYLESYPMFSSTEDITGSFIRTSPESFLYAARLIYESLSSNDEVWSTDNLSLFPNFARYWIEDGLEYLRINHEATARGIDINRIFIVTTGEYKSFRTELDQLGTLHAKAGVTPYLALYEKLPPACRYDFIIWNAMFVDEVVYDLRSTGIVDNYIHWSRSKVDQFGQKMGIIRNLVEADWTLHVERENQFGDILKYAGNVRSRLESLIQ